MENPAAPPPPKNNDTDSLEGSGSTVIEPSNNQPVAQPDNQTTTVSQPTKAPVAAPQSQLKKLLGHVRFNMYLVIFIAIIILAIIGIALVALHSSNASDKQPSVNNQTLSASQLSQLQGSNPVVGDSRQNLTIQSDTTFNGGVLVKNDLSVAGTLKIGGSLNLPGITVSGASKFGQLSANSLTVAGDFINQGNLTVQKSLTVAGSGTFSGSLSAGAISAQSLSLQNDLQITRHVTTSGGTPGRSNGSALGGGGTASVSGSDTAGSITINTGSSPGAGCFMTINFSRAFGGTPHVALTPTNAAAATLQYYVSPSAGNFSVCTASTPSGATSFGFDYIVID